MIKRICLILAACLSAGCNSVEYSRRSINEPAFPVVYERPSILIGSTARPSDDAAVAAAAPAQEQPIKIRMEYWNPDKEKLVEVRKGLAEDISENDFVGNRTVLKRTLIAAVTRGEFRPADRFVNFRLRIKPNNFEFTDYRGSASDYSVIDIASLSLEKSASASLDIVADKAQPAKLGVSRTLTETGTVSTRIENLTTNIDFDTLDIYREAERGIDLSGNTLVNVSVTPVNKPRDQRTDWAYVATSVKVMDSGAVLTKDAAEIKTADLNYIFPKDMTASVTFDYVMRRVAVRSNEYSEHNQTAFYEKGRCENDTAIVVRARDILIPLWYIVEANQAIQLNDGLSTRTLTFVSYTTAHRLVEWMKHTKAPTIGKHKFVFSTDGQGKISGGTYPALEIVPASRELAKAPETPWKCTSTTIQ